MDSRAVGPEHPVGLMQKCGLLQPPTCHFYKLDDHHGPQLDKEGSKKTTRWNVNSYVKSSLTSWRQTLQLAAVPLLSSQSEWPRTSPSWILPSRGLLLPTP